MSSPPELTILDDGSRKYLDSNGHEYVSVTTILKPLVDGNLLPWATKQAAEAALRIHRQFDITSRQQERDAIAASSLEYKNTGKYHADIGTYVHNMIVEHSQKGNVDESIDNDLAETAFDSYLLFEQEYSPEVLQSELLVYNSRRKVAGTLDAIIRIGSKRILLDYKTSRQFYPTHALQLGGYQWLYTEPVDELWVVRLNKYPSYGPSYEIAVVDSDLAYGGFMSMLNIHDILSNGGLYDTE